MAGKYYGLIETSKNVDIVGAIGHRQIIDGAFSYKEMLHAAKREARRQPDKKYWIVEMQAAITVRPPTAESDLIIEEF